MKMDEVNSEEYWHEWSNENETVNVYAINKPCVEMEDDECGDEMRQW